MILNMTTLALSIVAASVAVLMAVAVSVIVIVSMTARRFTTKVEMALARVQNLHLDQVKNETHNRND